MLPAPIAQTRASGVAASGDGIRGRGDIKFESVATAGPRRRVR
jgi:hypothetical protein